nr:hypothetical protein BaRGS_022543 [Batillaria attramentaria]
MADQKESEFVRNCGPVETEGIEAGVAQRVNCVYDGEFMGRLQYKGDRTGR